MQILTHPLLNKKPAPARTGGTIWFGAREVTRKNLLDTQKPPQHVETIVTQSAGVERGDVEIEGLGRGHGSARTAPTPFGANGTDIAGSRNGECTGMCCTLDVSSTSEHCG